LNYSIFFQRARKNIQRCQQLRDQFIFSTHYLAHRLKALTTFVVHLSRTPSLLNNNRFH